MADIDSPRARSFANERIRPLADKLAQAYYACRAVLDEWHAQGVSDEIPNTGDVIIDGSATDGRRSITGAEATNIVVRATEFCADYEASSAAKRNTVLSVAVNPQRR